jgi:hypothetical protein
MDHYSNVNQLNEQQQTKKEKQQMFHLVKKGWGSATGILV